MTHIIGPLIPIIISLGAFFMVWGLRYLENQENMAMIERGMEPRKKRRQADPSRTLKNGLIFVGAGFGLRWRLCCPTPYLPVQMRIRKQVCSLP